MTNAMITATITAVDAMIATITAADAMTNATIIAADAMNVIATTAAMTNATTTATTTIAAAAMTARIKAHDPQAMADHFRGRLEPIRVVFRAKYNYDRPHRVLYS